MMITVAVCTWNRAELLDKTLSEMTKLRVPSGFDWELVVVNNNCTDDTNEVISRHAASLPLRSFFEKEPGHSNARNRAIAEARGDWILFTDDDVLVDPGLLEAYCEAVLGCAEDVAFMGGAVEPWFPEPPDPVLVEAIPAVASGFCGLSVPKDGPIRSRGDGLPIGANFLISRERIGDVRFDKRFGRKGTQLLGGDETSFFRELLRRGFRGRWVSTARLRHYVIPERLTVPELMRFMFACGRSDVLLDGVPEGRTLFGAPGWVWKQTLALAVKSFWNRARGRRLEAIRSASRFNYRLGMLRECVLGGGAVE